MAESYKQELEMLKDALQQFAAVSHSTEIYRRSGIAATDVVSCLTIYMALEVVSCARSEGGRGKLTVTPARIWYFDYADKGPKADVDFSVDLGHKTRKWKVVVEATSPSLFKLSIYEWYAGEKSTLSAVLASITAQDSAYKIRGLPVQLRIEGTIERVPRGKIEGTIERIRRK